MKRDRELQIKFLQELRGDILESDVPKFADEIMAYNAALLIEEGLVDGRAVRDEKGQYVSAVLLNLTNAGQDFLDSLEFATEVPSTNGESDFPMEIFISHSSRDTALAAALVELLRAAFSLQPEKIRCTSVNGYKLSVGSDTDDQLRQEVRNSKVFLGIITPTSIQSTYVLFELGARWGAGFHLCPLLARGAKAEVLSGPLKGLHALDLQNEGDRMQLIGDLEKVLGLPSCKPQALLNHFKNVGAEAENLEKNRLPEEPIPEKAGLKPDTIKILKAFFELTGPIPRRDAAIHVGMDRNIFDYHVDILLEMNLVEEHGGRVAVYRGTRDDRTIEISRLGRKFIVEGEYI